MSIRRQQTPCVNESEEQAMEYALLLLGYRARTEAELRRRLDAKGFTPRVTDHTLAELTRLGLLDDDDFARSWVASRRGYGPARLKHELRVKGIARDLAEEIVATGISAEEEETAAWQVATRAVSTREQPLAREEVLRVRRLLQRRGFSYDVMVRVCARLNEQLTAAEDWLE